jgi:hypothetical protein
MYNNACILICEEDRGKWPWTKQSKVEAFLRIFDVHSKIRIGYVLNTILMPYRYSNLGGVILFVYPYWDEESLLPVDGNISHSVVRLKVKVKVLPIQVSKFLRAGRGVVLPNYKTSSLKIGMRVRITPRPLYPDKYPVPIVQEAGWAPQGRSGRVRKISPPTGFDPRTVHPVASRYTDWAIAAARDWRAEWFIIGSTVHNRKYE